MIGVGGRNGEADQDARYVRGTVSVGDRGGTNVGPLLKTRAPVASRLTGSVPSSPTATTMSNITSATCAFGLAQTSAGCVRTLASFDPSAYESYQIAYFVVGAVFLIASAVVYVQSVLHDGSPLQQANALFCCYASMTVVVRGVDPGSYGHVIPLPIFGLLSDTCTASLYSVYILALGYWATIIQQGAAITEGLVHLRVLERTAIAVVWVFYSANDLVLFAYKGFQPTSLIYEELLGSACILLIISATFLLYGLRVLRRLHEYERLRKLEMPTILERTMANHSFNMALSDDEDGVPVVTEPTYVSRRPQSGHAAKIRKILIVAETASLVVVAGQVFMAVSRASETSVELSCANGNSCETVKSSLNLLHVFQVLCVAVVLWIFRTTQKKEVVPRPH